MTRAMTSITDDASAGGIWFDGNGVYDLDGQFITGLAELYDDDNWRMYDEDGNVQVTETADEGGGRGGGGGPPPDDG